MKEDSVVFQTAATIDNIINAIPNAKVVWVDDKKIQITDKNNTCYELKLTLAK